MKYFFKISSIICLASMLFLNSGIYSQSVFKELDEKATKAYTDGQFHYAIELYDSIINMGYVSAALYYNLGNAYFKTDHLPYAILYYEKAKKLDPSDDNIEHNLIFANTLTTDKINELPLLFYQKWWQALYNKFTTDNWAIIFLIFTNLFILFFAIYLITNRLFLKKLSFFAFLLFFVISIFTIIFAQKQYNSTYKLKSAIVFTPRVTAKSSPDNYSIDLFVIHEGTKVYIREDMGEWYEIALANGNVGWISKKDVKII